jgi:electron transport complex protein RnfD
MSEKQNMLITASPQIHSPETTAKIMWLVTLSLVPAGIWGIFVFGARSILVIGVSILASVISEYVIARISKKSTILDGSAFLTGLLIGYNMPAAVPLFIPAVASVFAIVVVKWSFGGLGGNWMNPALAGRVFVFFSWTGGMTTWTMPGTVHNVVDTVSHASPLGFIKAGLLDFSGGLHGPVEFLSNQGYPHSGMAESIAEWFGNIGITIPYTYIDGFLGNIPGCIGEVSALFLLLGGIFLLIRKIITWHIPVAYFGSFALLVWIFGGFRYNTGFFTGDPLFHILTGGMMLGVLFMATDMVTSPITGKGMIIFGVGAGFLTFMIRFYGSFPEGVSLAIILMNIFVPMINRYTQPVRFGTRGSKK